MKKQWVLCVALLAFGLYGAANGKDPAQSVVSTTAKTDDTIKARAIADGVAEVNRYRRALARTMQFVSSHPELFPTQKSGAHPLRTTAQRRQVRQVWQNLLDYIVALDAVKTERSQIYEEIDAPFKYDAFAVLYAAFLAQYRYSLAFLYTVENDPSLDVVLNENDPELGLAEKTYSAFKFRFLNVVIATQFVAMNTLASQCKEMPPELAAGIQEDKAYIWQMGRGKGEAMTLKNALTIMQTAGHSTWLPVQQGIAEWMGDTKVWRKTRNLMSAEQIAALPGRLQPGDILLERREWHLSNIGLPGFWPHVALYVGTPEERKAYFDGDPEVCRWLRDQKTASCSLEAFLQARYPVAYGESLTLGEEHHPPRIIEAIGEGVCFTTIEHSAACDSLAVLRPRLSKREKARAVLCAFSYQGRPYDFDFDFMTDAALVCSELVYKSYEPSGSFKGLTLPLVDMLGRKVTPPNEIVRQFDRQWGTHEQQTEMVVFYDGNESSGKALPADLETFRSSWRRPKWHILMQGPAPEPAQGSGVKIQ